MYGASLKVVSVSFFFKYGFSRNIYIYSTTKHNEKTHATIILERKKVTWSRTSQNWPLLRKAFSLATDDSMKFSSSNIKYPLGIILELVWLRTECVSFSDITFCFHIEVQLTHHLQTFVRTFSKEHPPQKQTNYKSTIADDCVNNNTLDCPD